MDPESPVHAELPPGFTELDSSFTGIRIAHGIRPGAVRWEFFHYCAACGGWVEGLPIRHNVNGIKSIRSGLGRFCARCDADLQMPGDGKDA